MILHGYFRSTASYRVRIALNIKGVTYLDEFHHLRRGEHRHPDFLALNPQGLLPVLEAGGAVFTQSLAICEFLDEMFPAPSLLPDDPIERAHVRAFAQVIACDIHPVQNLKILARLQSLGLDEAQTAAWARETIDEGLTACNTLIEGRPGPFCFGNAVTLADICLVPQLVNARRFGVELRWPRLLAVEAACLKLDAFYRAAPDQQPDCE